MLYRSIVITPPEIEPITLEEANTHLRVSGQDEEVTRLITVARKSLERYLKRTFITTQYKVFSECWHECMHLPYPTLQSVESVKYIDINGDEQTLSEPDYYHVVTNDDPGYIKKRFDACYPELDYGNPDAISIEYTAGYGDTANDVPEDIRHALKLMITNYYEQRGDIIIGSVTRIPNYILDLVHDYRIYQF